MLCGHCLQVSCLMSVNIGWQGGIHVQSCGHYVHLTCLKSYVESLRNDAQHSNQLRTEKGEPIHISIWWYPFLMVDFFKRFHFCVLQFWRDMHAIHCYWTMSCFAQASFGVRCVGNSPTPRCLSYRKWDLPSSIPSRPRIATPSTGSPAISPPNTTRPYVS